MRSTQEELARPGVADAEAQLDVGRPPAGLGEPGLDPLAGSPGGEPLAGREGPGEQRLHLAQALAEVGLAHRPGRTGLRGAT